MTNFVNISNYNRIAGRQVAFVHCAGNIKKREKDVELGNFSRSVKRQHAQELKEELGLGL